MGFKNSVNFHGIGLKSPGAIVPKDGSRFSMHDAYSRKSTNNLSVFDPVEI
jgi:hypothetical protein